MIEPWVTFGLIHLYLNWFAIKGETPADGAETKPADAPPSDAPPADASATPSAAPEG